MIYSKVRGTGLPLIFLHGYGEDHSLWDNLVESLSTKYQLITLDLPGFGESDRLPGNFSIDNVADKILQHLELNLGIKHFVVFGHSLGGYVSLAMAERASEKVKGIGLINSTTLKDSPEKKKNRVKTADFIRKHKASFFLKSFVPNLFYEKNRHKLQSEIDFVIAMGNNLDEELLADYMIAMKNRPDRSYVLESFNHVLFIGGKNDTGFSANDYKKQISCLKNRNNAHILDNVGHMVMYEAPEKLNSVIDNFLKSV